MLDPVLFSYLPVWLENGPDGPKVREKTANNDDFSKKSKKQAQADGLCTLVCNETLNNVLKAILKLILNNLGTEEAGWMKRIAGRHYTAKCAATK